MSSEKFKAFERDGYSRAAEGYASTSAKVSSQANTAILDKARVSRGSRVLDVACGPGFLTGDALRRGAIVTAIDFAPGMVAIAKESYPAAMVMEADAESLPFADASFDAVVCCLGLLHFPQPERAVVEAYRVLAYGGVYAFACWRPPADNPLMALILGAIHRRGTLDVDLPPGPPLFRFGDPAACKDVLEEAGFLDVATSDISIEWLAESPEAFVQQLPSSTVRLAALLEAQAPKQRAAIEAEIAIEAKAYSKDGAVRVPAKVLLASGRRIRETA